MLRVEADQRVQAHRELSEPAELGHDDGGDALPQRRAELVVGDVV